MGTIHWSFYHELQQRRSSASSNHCKQFLNWLLGLSDQVCRVSALLCGKDLNKACRKINIDSFEWTIPAGWHSTWKLLTNGLTEFRLDEILSNSLRNLKLDLFWVWIYCRVVFRTSRASTMELFCKNSLAVIYFCMKAPLQMFDWVLNTLGAKEIMEFVASTLPWPPSFIREFPAFEVALFLILTHFCHWN